MNKRLGVAVIALLLAVSAWALLARSRSDHRSDGIIASQDFSTIEPQVIHFCGACHAMPNALAFNRDAWFHEVDRGFEFYYLSGRTDLDVPVKKDVYAYFRSLAPEVIDIPRCGNLENGGLSFRQVVVMPPNALRTKALGADPSPAVSHIKLLQRSTDDDPKLLISDMRRRNSWILEFDGQKTKSDLLVDDGNFAHGEPLHDGDLSRDTFVLSDLGSFQPEEHDRGRVLFVQKTHDDGSVKSSTIATGLARVADARPADFDRDGDTDFVVAEFGLIKTGRVLLLRDQGSIEGVPSYEVEVLDDRHGAIHVPVVDINSDGWMDFFVLLSQEHETIELFRNDQQGGFVKEIVMESNEPSYGSSGIELTDLDGDGDVDVLYTNGDMYDSFDLKPNHAVHWVENDNGRWVRHQILAMPGVFRAIPSDLDSDGDLDIVATAFVPDLVSKKHPKLSMASLVWIEQTSPGKFKPHALEIDKTNHAAVEAGDFDRDGDVDLAVGNFQGGIDSAITLWWNETGEQ